MEEVGILRMDLKSEKEEKKQVVDKVGCRFRLWKESTTHC